MKRYIVLRNNKESGPFSREELEVFGLSDRDLVWIEGQSTTWEHPGNLDELKHISEIASPGQLPNPEALSAPSKTFADLSLQDYLKTYSDDSGAATPSSVKQIPLQPTGKDNRDSFVLLSKFFGFGLLLAGLLLCGAVVTQVVKSFGALEGRVSEAVEIKAEKLPPSTTQHAALSLPADTVQQMATATDTAAERIAGAAALPAVKPPIVSQTKPAAQIKKRGDTAAKQNLAQETAPDEVVAEKTEEEPPPPPVDYAAALRLSANEFKTGLFGGVSELEITVTNTAAKKISRAVIEVSFLKPNGNVVKTQTLTVEDIAAGGSKTVPVPPSNRGVKVSHRVLSAE